MLMKNDTTTAVVCETQALADQCILAGYTAMLLTDLPALAHENYIVVAKAPETLVSELIASGISDKSISTVASERFWDTPVAQAIESAALVNDERVKPLSEAVEASYEYIKCQMQPFDKHIIWRYPEICVTTGAYGCGKSTFEQIRALEWWTAGGKARGETAVLCAWEDDPWDIKERVTAYLRYDGLADEEISEALNAIHFVDDTRGDLARSIDWFTDMIEENVRTRNAKYFVLDPYNEMDHEAGSGNRETTYVRDLMRRLRALAQKHKIIINITTHLPKAQYDESGKVKPFRVANAIGSVEFGNKADRGICIMRVVDPEDGPKGEFMFVRFDKVKVEKRMGKKGTYGFKLDPDTSQLHQDVEATAYVQEVWR